ncbi:hypothetical protein ACFL0M_07580 [Thermodesulfobacteriota bacterium]
MLAPIGIDISTNQGIKIEAAIHIERCCYYISGLMLLIIPGEIMEYDYAFEIAAANLRFGPGMTRAVGMDLANLGIKRVMVLTDPNLRSLPPVETVLTSFAALPFNKRPKPQRPILRSAYQGSNHVSDIWSLQALRTYRNTSSRLSKIRIMTTPAA